MLCTGVNMTTTCYLSMFRSYIHIFMLSLLLAFPELSVSQDDCHKQQTSVPTPNQLKDDFMSHAQHRMCRLKQ